MNAYFYDLECYSTLFLAVFIPLDTPQELVDEYIHVDIYEKDKAVKFTKKQELIAKMKAIKYRLFYEINELSKFCAFMKQPNLTLFGFNNSRYDDILSDYVVANERMLSTKSAILATGIIKAASDNIIDVGYQFYKLEPSLDKYKHSYVSIDVLNSLFETVERKPLKQFAILLQWYRIQDLPFKPESIIERDQLEDVEDYCHNDCFVLRAIFFNRREEFVNKAEYSALYGINLMNKNRSSIADALLAKFYSDATGMNYYEFKDKRTYRSIIHFNELVSPLIKYHSQELNEFLNKILNTRFIVGSDEFSHTLIFRGTKYQLGVGGIHSVDAPGLFKSTDTHVLRDVDADSYYPNNVINLKIAPKHLQQPVFTAIAFRTTTDRIAAKKAGNKAVAGALKIVVNSGLFGKQIAEIK